MESNPAFQSLKLSRAVLVELTRIFSAEIARGLAADGEQIKALRTFLRPPEAPTRPHQQVAVIDVGGTNCRAALLRQGPAGLEIVAGPLARALPFRAEVPLPAEAFFELQAELLAQLGPEPGAPLGYCFSYPAEIQPALDAKLLRWTKGIDVPGVVGTLVGTRLRGALARLGVSPGGLVVLNDTVACLMGAALDRAAPHLAIGLIAGTGTNMAGFFEASRAPKLAGTAGAMALNLESGNLSLPPNVQTPADEAIDRADSPGSQRFEKAVSGHYLPYVFAELASVLQASLPAFDPARGSGALAALAEDPAAPGLARALARAVFERSADLIAAGLAAILDHYPEGRVTIAAEGSLFWRTPGYAARVSASLGALVGRDRFDVVQREHINLLGAARAALQCGTDRAPRPARAETPAR